MYNKISSYKYNFDYLLFNPISTAKQKDLSKEKRILMVSFSLLIGIPTLFIPHLVYHLFHRKITPIDPNQNSEISDLTRRVIVVKNKKRLLRKHEETPPPYITNYPKKIRQKKQDAPSAKIELTVELAKPRSTH